MSLTEKLENVVDRDTFLEFVKALIDDWEKDQAEIAKRKESNAFSPVWDNSEWESGSIGQYLEAASGWAMGKKLPENPTWRIFAEILYAGKICE